MRANWRLLSIILIGVIVAVALLSSVPLYSNAINDLGLEHSLRDNPVELLDLQFYAPNYYINSEEYQDASELISEMVHRDLDDFLRQEESWIQTQFFDLFYTDRPTPGGPYQPTGLFQWYSNLDEHITITEGRPAEYVKPGSSGEGNYPSDFAIEGMIGSETAAILEVDVGDRIILRSGFGTTEKNITVELSAFIDPVDPEDEFWFLNSQVFAFPLEDAEGNYVPPRAPVFIPEETLFEILPDYFPTARASYNWGYYTDIDEIRSDNAGYVKNSIRKIEREILQALPRSGLFTTLDTLISEFTGRLLFTQIPLFIIVFQVVAIILFYLMMVSNMVVERQSDEISIFRSRGAGTWHVLLIYLIEGLLLSIIGSVIGALLGAFLFSLLGKTDSFMSLTGGQMMPIRFSGIVVVLTITAAALCLFAMLVPAVQASRRGIVQRKQTSSRPSSAPFWQRFYLDIVLLAVGIALFWELRQRGSLVSMDVFGGLGMDPLVLLTPVLLILAVAIVFLRLFPLLVKLASWFTRYIGNISLALGLWRMARQPVHYTRLILFLVVAISVGMFSSTFIGSLQQNYNERNIYLSGGDLRLESLSSAHSLKKTLEEKYADLEGVENVGVAYRQKGYAGTTYSSAEFELLAVDPEPMRSIAWFREDFADKSLGELMDILAEDTPRQEGIPIPEDAETIGIRVRRAVKDDYDLSLYARIRDGKNRFLDVKMTGAGPAQDDWQYLESKLSIAGSSDFLPPPCSLISLYFMTSTTGFSDVLFREIYVDDLQLDGPGFSVPLIIDDFEELSEWKMSPDELSMTQAEVQGLSGSFEADRFNAFNGESSGRLRWNTREMNAVAVYPSPDDRPLSVIASRSFMDRTGIVEGEVARIRLSSRELYISVAEVIEYFPGLDPDSRGFIITNIDRLFTVRNRQPGSSVYPNEVWLSLDDNAELRNQVVDRISSSSLKAKGIYFKDAMIAGMKDDPLAGAAWSGILMIALAGVLLVSSLGFVVYSYLSAKERQLDFAVLRAVGISRRQVVGLVFFEQIVIIALGLVIGTVTGDRLSHIMLPFLQLAEHGSRVLPPYVLVTDWATLGLVYGILLLAFFITGALLITFFSRIKIPATLRGTDI